MKLRIQPKLFIFIGVILLLNIIFPPPAVPQRYEISSGEIANQDVIAPYDFFIPKTDQQLREEREGIARRIPRVFVLDNAVPSEISRRISTLEGLIDSTRKLRIGRDSATYIVQKQYALSSSVISHLLRNNRTAFDKLREDLGELYATGIIDRKIADNRIIAIISGNKETLESIDRLYSVEEAESIAAVRERSEYRALVRFFMTPNIRFDTVRTEERIEEVFANVPKTKGKVLKGEIIAEKHKRVDAATVEKILALESTYTSIGTLGIVKTLLFRNILYLAFIFLLFKFDVITKIRLFDTKNLYFISLLSVSYLVIGTITHAMDVIYLTPIAFFIFMFALYFNFYVAILFTFVFASLFGVILDSAGVFTFLFASGLVATFSSQTIDSRLAFYRPLTYLSIANVGAILFVDLYLNDAGFNLLHIGAGVANSILVTISFVLFLPLFERLFDFTTDLTLLELGNLNLPIFKDMAIEAPGTYHHSIIVGNLAEAGARYIDADPVLARVGAYYHDIGKLKKPEYFIENQIGIRNPHDSLKPQMSALIIISHVKDGMEAARKMKLPRKILEIIEQHHGTTMIELFYKQALESSKDTAQDSYRYPGPRPKTKETALVMLADSVEAAARGERNITAAKLQKIVRESVDKKFNDGQLDDCPVTRHDLEQVKTAFVPILTGVFHPRVDYEQTGMRAAAGDERKNK
ncbi:MAG: HDIG domain-containing protein [candidate division WOR-3 bacterium]|nr:MAG: HDIG domain-containing protein [candidate division WOR-3 bacterium]